MIFFNSPVPINVKVNWLQLEGNALAGASPTAYYSGFANAPNPNEVYPVALAEKILRREINNSDEPDIEITVNSQIEWHYDFASPATIGTKFDFVSVLLHEMFHGLGFLSNTGVNDENIGFLKVFTNNNYYIFNDFLKDGAGINLIDVEDESTAMGLALTSNDLFFHSTFDDSKHQIYAPNEWEPGSSMSHLDERTFNNTPNSLMTPSASRGEIELSPGVATDIMHDMGWDFTYLLHTPTPGSEDLDQDFTVEVEVISDTPIEESSLKLIYSVDEFTSDRQELSLTRDATTGLYQAILPAPNQEVTYSYFLEAVNVKNKKFSNPGQAPEFYFTYVYAIDDIIPEIIHRRINTVNNVDPSVDIEASINDEFIGVEEARVEWAFNGSPQPNITMTRLTDFSGNDFTNDYEATLQFPGGAPSITDVIDYRIIAIDGSKAKNQAVFPLRTDFASITVEAVEEARSVYVNDFNLTSDDFTGMGFSITQPSGFLDDALHSTHPYPEEGGTGFINLIHELSIPIKILESNGIMSFDEIVIVEPGEPTAAFGQDEFWDYVIVEGKKVGTSEWLPFLNGYDCRGSSVWLNAFNNGESGTPSMFKKRTIDMTASGNFAADDEVFIRFRLFSDPFAFGWGWAIDNLLIQDETTPVEDFILQEKFTISPNPASELIRIDLSLETSPDKVKVTIVDLSGKVMIEQTIENPIRNLIIKESIEHFESGIYVAQITFNNKESISKKFVVTR